MSSIISIIWQEVSTNLRQPRSPNLGFGGNIPKMVNQSDVIKAIHRSVRMFKQSFSVDFYGS